MDISKHDWKLFREKLPVWQENYMDRLNREYIVLLSAEDKKASEKFWELEKRIKDDRRHPGVIMRTTKSEVIWNIVDLIRADVITVDDLGDFSDDLRQEVGMMLGKYKIVEKKISI